jgi:predicted dienelactone hydrolase
MRPLEVFLLVVTASAAVGVLLGRWPRTSRIFLGGAIVTLIAHGLVEGLHWQMIPVYLAICVLCVIAWKEFGRGPRVRVLIASSALLLATASVIFSIMLPMFRLPNPTGAYPVGTSILYFKDSTRIEDSAPGSGRARELMVQLWYPAQASHNRFARYREPRETSLLSSYQSVLATHSRLDAPIASDAGSFPIVLFNHGWRGIRTNDTFLAEELASHGYVVASIDHTYNARLVAFPDGRVVHANAPYDIDDPEISTPEQVRAKWDKELSKWVADQRFVLDRLEDMNRAVGTPWYGRLNTNVAAAIGHSFGGAAATAVCANDRRVRSSVNMDGWFFGAIRERGPNQPLLFMESYSESVGAPPNANGTGAVLDATDAADMQASLRRFGGDLLVIKGIGHEDFTDQPLVSPLRMVSHRGTLPARRIHTIVRSYVVAFFDKTLRGDDPVILHAYSRPYVEARLEEWPTK